MTTRRDAIPTTRSRQRWVVAASILVIATTFWAVVRPASAAPIADDQYVGMTSDLGDFTLGVFDRGVAVIRIDIGAPRSPYPNSCFGTGSIATDGILFQGVRLETGSSDREISDPTTGELRILRLSGRLHTDGIAVGDLSISGYPDEFGFVCTPRSFSWAAVARSTEEPPLASTTYRGAVSAGQTFGGLVPAGTVSLTTGANGTTIEEFAIVPTQSCAASNLGSIVTVLDSGSTSIAESASEGNAQLIGRYRVSIAGNRAIGAFLVDRDRFDCKPLAGVFIASPAAAPTPTPTPAVTPTGTPIATPLPGRFAAAPVYPPSGSRLAQVVFLGGSIAQLSQALVASNSGGAWAQGPDGVYHLYIVGVPDAINARFMQAFPGGFTSTTALTLVGSEARPT